MKKKPLTVPVRARTKKQPPATPLEIIPNKSAVPEFMVLAIGGGIASIPLLSDLLNRFPAKPGMAIIFAPVSERGWRKDLAAFLASNSSVRVCEVSKQTKIEADTVYILSPGVPFIFENRLLTPASKTARKNGFNVDSLFSALAQQLHEKLVGLLLSGSGADGICGLAEIRTEGGLAYLAKEIGQPSKLIELAIAAQAADFVLPPRKLAEELVRLGEIRSNLEPEISDEEQMSYRRAFALLRALTNVDFSKYKPSTLKRRINRRIVITKTETLAEYVAFLQKNPPEVDNLFHDLLINVTSFFRDPEAFQALKTRVFPGIIQTKAADSPIRIWVPGCSTGEEVYSIAMALVEFLGKRSHTTSIQIFATDISEPVLARARAGKYPLTIASSLSPERLRRWFVRTENGYQISKVIRDTCVFACQNVFEDPPFSKLDLISCRNVMIYLGSVLQKKIIPTFYYALKPNGYLLLGGSETIGQFSELFDLVDKRSKLYHKAEAAKAPEVEFRRPPRKPPKPTPAPTIIPPPEKLSPPDIGKHVDRILLSAFAPAGVVVNSKFEVIQFRGQTGLYLEHGPGDASLNVVKMAKENLGMELRPLLSRAAKLDAVLRKDGIRFKPDNNLHIVSLEVIPIKNPPSKERFFLVLFSERKADLPPSKKETDKKLVLAVDHDAVRLREELVSTKESLQAIIEEQEATNEELKSANEEIQSTNEELQSSNEELETTKEELQSSNEELTTLNEELQTRNGQISQVNNDLTNLISSVSIPIVMMGNDLTIRKFSPSAERLFNLIPGDIGRPVSDLNHSVVIDGLETKIQDVIETLRTYEEEVQDKAGRWYVLRIRPYRTSDNKIDGAVLVMVDVNEIKQGLEEVTSLVTQPLVILYGDFRIMRANPAFYRTFGLDEEATKDQSIFELENGEWNVPTLRVLLEGILPERKKIERFKLEHTFASMGARTFYLNASILYRESKGTQLIFLAFSDA